MKVYRTRNVAMGLTGAQAAYLQSWDNRVGIALDHVVREATSYQAAIYRYKLTRRTEVSHDFKPEGKQLLKLLPAWAKHKALPSIGHKVTAFYAVNDKVVCDLTKPVVGSDEWLLDQDDPHRAAHLFLFHKYGMYAEEFPHLVVQSNSHSLRRAA